MRQYSSQSDEIFLLLASSFTTAAIVALIVSMIAASGAREQYEQTQQSRGHYVTNVVWTIYEHPKDFNQTNK